MKQKSIIQEVFEMPNPASKKLLSKASRLIKSFKDREIVDEAKLRKVFRHLNFTPREVAGCLRLLYKRADIIIGSDQKFVVLKFPPQTMPINW